MQDGDSIAYFNRTYAKKNKDEKLLVIPGAFYKVRAQGGASNSDSDKITQMGKRSIATFGVMMVHSYCVTNFLYEAKIVTLKRMGASLHNGIAYAFYPLGLALTVGFYLK